MTIEANKQLVRTFFERIGRLEVDAAFALLAPDMRWWIPTDRPGGQTLTKAEMRQGVAGFVGIFATPPVMQLGRITAEGNRVCVEQTGRGGRTHGGAEYANDYMISVEIADGLITEIREYMNPLLAAAIVPELQQFQAG